MTSGGRLVVLGAGFSGLLTAVHVARTNSYKEVLLIDEREFQVYTPWLYEVVTCALRDDSKKIEKEIFETAGVSIKKIIQGEKRLRFKHSRVEDCDFSQKHIILADGKTVAYDKLVVALGSSTSFFGIDGFEKYALPIKSLDSALKVREVLLKTLKKTEPEIVIVGGGATGVETASELVNFLRRDHSDSGAKITVVESGESVLKRFPESMQRSAKKRLKHLGVRIWNGVRIEKVKDGIIQFQGEDKGEAKFDMLMWAGGSVPAGVISKFALPKDRRGKIRVRNTLQVEGHPDVFAAGDIVSFEDTDGRFAPAAAWSAVEQAEVLVKNLTLSHQKAYKLPKHFPAIVAVGGKYAVGSVAGIPIKGRKAYLLRRLVDFNYFRKVFSFREAYRFWRNGLSIFSKND